MSEKKLIEETSIKAAIRAVRQAIINADAYAAERAKKDLSIGTISTLSKELSSIERRFLAYDED